MSLKKITSLIILLSFIILFLSTIVLYIAPPGYYSAWEGWDFLFVKKGLWKDLHITIGFVFFIFVFIHGAYNLRLILKYLKKAGSVFFSKDFIAALALVAICWAGTAYKITPFKDVLNLNSKIKKAWVKKIQRPPFRHAELATLKKFSEKTGLSFDLIKKRLGNKGYKNIYENQTLLKIASENGISPSAVYRIIMSD